MRYKKRERETKRIHVPLNCSDSNLWTRGWRIATLLLPRCRARPFARCRHHPPERWSRGCSRRRFPQRRGWILCFERCQRFLRVHTCYTRRLKENNKKQQRGRNDGEEERHRSSVRRPPRVRRHYPLSPEQHACVIFEGSLGRKRFLCVLFLNPTYGNKP